MTLDGKRILVTGATAGIGKAAVELLSRDGADVIAHGRHDADLASLAQVRDYVDRVPAIDVLVNNAGVGAGAPGDGRETSHDGYELRLAVNFIAPFALTEWLLAAGRCPPVVVNVASIGQAPVDLDDLMLERSYEGWHAYRRSKLALIAWTFDLAARHPERCAVALHPGTLLDTRMVRESQVRPLGKVETGADAIRHAILAALVHRRTGVYFDVKDEARVKDQAYDVAFRTRLRQRAAELVAPFARGLCVDTSS